MFILFITLFEHPSKSKPGDDFVLDIITRN